MAGPVRAAITGGPGAGKSTLLEELARRGLSVEGEAARTILQMPHGMALREEDPRQFAEAMFAQEQIAFARAETSETATVFDRGFPDTVGFLRVEGLEVPLTIDRACRELRYSGPIFRAPPWREIYHSDAERTQDWNQARASDLAVCAAWREYGYELVDLPLASVSVRAEWLISRLG